MRILLATTKLYPPQFFGGAEVSADALCRQLVSEGHEVAVLSGLAPKGSLTVRNRIKSRARRDRSLPADTANGYPVFRGWDPLAGAESVIRRFHPDVVVAASGEVMRIASKLIQLNVPSVVYLHHTHVHSLGGAPLSTDEILYLANSRYTANYFKTHFNLDTQVLFPLIEAPRYRVATDRSRVLFVNPNPMKGTGRVLEIAKQRPDIPFDIIESWTLPEHLVATFRATAAALPNVRWHRARDDMRSVYRRGRLLLAPSGVGYPEWVESWGRVVSEAQTAGIPAIATNDGGLPESVGPGGILLDRVAPFESWLDALDKLWNDNDLYDDLSRKALMHSQRQELSTDYLVRRFLELVREHINRGSQG